jgi:flagellar basal body L-ring protein FlgH
LCVDFAYYVCGSCNWTNNSQKNTEAATLVRFNATGETAYRQLVEDLSRRAISPSKADLTLAVVVRDARSMSRKAEAERTRAKSSSGRFTTAQKWRLAAEQRGKVAVESMNDNVPAQSSNEARPVQLDS